MGFMDKFLDAMRLNDEDEYEFDNEEYEDDYEADEPRHSRSHKEKEEKQAASSRPVRRETASETREKSAKQTNKITPIRRSLGKQVPEEMEVCIIKPSSVADEQEITETLLEGRAVVINMEGLNMETAQRIMDFVAGSTFAIHGNLQKISNFVFIATPQSVDVSGDIQSLMDSVDLSDL